MPNRVGHVRRPGIGVTHRVDVVPPRGRHVGRQPAEPARRVDPVNALRSGDHEVSESGEELKWYTVPGISNGG